MILEYPKMVFYADVEKTKEGEVYFLGVLSLRETKQIVQERGFFYAYPEDDL